MMASRIMAGLSLCTLASCGAPTTARPASSEVARPSDINGVRLSLELRAILDPAARGLEPSKMLEVTLRNHVGSHDVALINAGLAPSGGGALGVIRINLRSGTGALENRCFVNSFSSSDRDYIYLAPGDAITRVVKLSCYQPPRDERLLATVTYEDRAPPAEVAKEAPVGDDPLQLPCAAEKGLAPEELARAYRGPLVSNTIEFGLDQP
jgi:hypothetical protein